MPLNSCKHTHDDEWQEGDEETNPYIMDTTVHHSIYEIASCLDSHAGKEKYKTDIPDHERRGVCCIGYELYLISETS